MPNSIALAKNYANLLDSKYKMESVTSVLDTPSELVKWAGANAVYIPTMELDGLADYSRNGGYVAGAETLTYTPYTLRYDRGRAFNVDVLDDEETRNVAFSQLAGEFIKQRVAPEIDATRFSLLAGTSGILSASADITVGTTNCLDLVDTAVQDQDEAEVGNGGKILFVSPQFYRGIKKEVERTIMNGEDNIQREVLTLDTMRVIIAPKNRFNTGIDLMDGTTSGETGGGYENPASTTYGINFMLVDPSAVMQVVKHAKTRVFSPDENQTANAYKYDYRIYHDLFVYGNKAKGIYMHRRATANASKVVG